MDLSQALRARFGGDFRADHRWRKPADSAVSAVRVARTAEPLAQVIDSAPSGSLLLVVTPKGQVWATGDRAAGVAFVAVLAASKTKMTAAARTVAADLSSLLAADGADVSDPGGILAAPEPKETPDADPDPADLEA